MNVIEFVSYGNENRLSRIKEAGFAVKFSQLNFDVVRSSLAMFLIDLARNSIKETESNPVLYDFLKSYLIALDTEDMDLKFLPHYFSIDLAKYLGFEPRANYSPERPFFDLMEGAYIDNNMRHTQILSEMHSKHLFDLIEKREGMVMDRQLRGIMLDKLLDYYKLHIEGFRELKSLGVLRSLLS